MDKNTITGLLLIALILIGYNYYTTSSETELAVHQQQKTEQLAQQAAAHKSSETPATTALKVDSTDLFFNALKEKDNAPIVLKNNKVSLDIAPKGGFINKVVLNEYKSYNDYHNGVDSALVLFDAKTASMNFALETTDGIYNTENLYFTAVEPTDSSVTMQLASTQGDTLNIRYTLLPNAYMVNTQITAQGKHFKGNKLGIEWKDKVRRLEKGFYFENMYSTLTYRDNEGDTEKLGEYNDSEESPENPVQWIACKNQYFSAVMINANNYFTDVQLKSDTCSEESGFIKAYTSKMNLALSPNKESAQLQFYFGPNKYRYLQSMEDLRIGDKTLDLETLVYLGWPLFKWINRFFTIYVFDFLTGFGMNMGIVLLLITLLLRFIVYPAAKKSYVSSAKMRVLKPKIDEISAKYPDKTDAMKRQQETMSLYSQYGVSPMGGCLPMLIQMPIWIAMFNFIPNAFELRQQSFLFCDDLSTYDSFISFSSHYWLIGNHISLFCLLFCGTNLLYSWIMMKQQSSSMSKEQADQMKVMRWMMFMMPIFFFFMFNKYSAGLNYYYFLSLLAGALTMWYLKRTTDDKKLLEKLEENYRQNKNNPKKMSGFAARLQAMQEAQQAELRKRQEQNKKH